MQGSNVGCSDADALEAAARAEANEVFRQLTLASMLAAKERISQLPPTNPARRLWERKAKRLVLDEARRRGIRLVRKPRRGAGSTPTRPPQPHVGLQHGGRTVRKRRGGTRAPASPPAGDSDPEPEPEPPSREAFAEFFEAQARLVAQSFADRWSTL